MQRKHTGRRNNKQGKAVTGVGDGVERRWSPARPVRRGTVGEGGVHRRSKTRGWVDGSMELEVSVVAGWCEGDPEGDFVEWRRETGGMGQTS